MKKPVLQREMFVAKIPKSGSKGILSGFDEEMENEDYEDRSPENLEIIANNLRGDIRSMDERYLELAQLVGETAFDTPEEVVALMQSQMGQQPQQQQPTPAPSGGGIAALGAPVTPQAPQGIMQGVAEPPAQEAPVQMAQGGPVYRQQGSFPWGEVKDVLDYFKSFPSPPPTGDYPEGTRRLGFMKYLPQGTLAQAGQVPPSSYTIPRVVVQPTIPMSGLLTGEAAQFIASGAARPGSLPAQIPASLRASTAISEGMRNFAPFAREVGRTIMSTPQGRGAAIIGGGALATIPFLTGGRETPSTEPDYSEVPGVDAQGRYRPVPRYGSYTPDQLANFYGDAIPSAVEGETSLPPPPEPGAEGGFTPVPGATGAISPEYLSAESLAKKGEGPRPKTLQERVKDRIAIYKDVLGDDENMRQAQALFLLAESALNVAGATGRNIGERLAKGLKGLPAGMGALGAEKARQDLAIRSAAVSAVESEMAQEAKSGTQLAIKVAELNAKNAGLAEVANYLAETYGFDPKKALQIARLSKENAIKVNDANEMVDLTGRVIHSPFRLVEGDVGYLPEKMPFVTVGAKSFVPATAKERASLAESMAANQKLASDIDQSLRLPHYETAFGPIARIQSGLTSLTVPIFGDNVPLTSLPKQVQTNVLMQLNNDLIQLSARNTSKPSVWEQKQVQQFINNPKAILANPTEFFGVLNNFRIKAINEANIAAHRLTGEPLRQISLPPLGTENDPLKATDAAYLPEFFRLRPNGAIFIEMQDPRYPNDPNKLVKKKFTAKEYFQQMGQQ